MKAATTRRSLLLLLTLLPLLVASCQSNPWKRKVFHVDSGAVVYLEALHDEKGNRVELGNSHPVDLSEGQVRSILSTLKFFQARVFLGDKDDKIFKRSEVERLVKPLVEALKSVDPDERVRFLLLTHQPLFLFERYLGTSAVVFAENPDRIEIAFDMIQEEVSVADGDPRKVRFSSEPTEIAESAFTLIPDERFSSLHIGTSSENPHPMWLTIDPAKVPDRFEQSVAATNPPVGSAATISADFLFQYRGCDIYRVDSTYYGLPPEAGEFDLEKVQKKEYRLLFSGPNAEEVIKDIEEARKAGLLN